MDQIQQNQQITQTGGRTDKDPVRITITLPTNAYFMSGIRDFTLSMIRNMTNFSDQWAYRFQSVVDELCNNAIEHGSNKKQEIKVIFINIPSESIEIIVEDSGTGNSKMKARELQNLVAERVEPGYAFREIRGRGLAKIVHAWTDELKFEDIENAGIRARVKKYLKVPEPTRPVVNAASDPTHVVLVA